MLSEASQGVVHSENNVDEIPPLEPIVEEEESEDEMENFKQWRRG